MKASSRRVLDINMVSHVVFSCIGKLNKGWS